MKFLPKGIKNIPLIFDTDYSTSIGFYAKIQGYKLKTNNLRKSIKNLLLKEEIILQDKSDEIEMLIHILLLFRL